MIGKSITFILFAFTAFTISFIIYGCTPPSNVPVTSYIATVSYQDALFCGASLSNQTILVLPVLTKDGFDSTASIGPGIIAHLLQKVRGDIEPVEKEGFETRYRMNHDSASLAAFYIALYNDSMLVLTASNSVWQKMSAAYCCVTRIKKALTIFGFNGVVKRRMEMETEFWNVDSAMVSLRIQTSASASGSAITDAAFVIEAMKAAFAKVPIYAPANNEKNW
jgi:hypothetical protein